MGRIMATEFRLLVTLVCFSFFRIQFFKEVLMLFLCFRYECHYHSYQGPVIFYFWS